MLQMVASNRGVAALPRWLAEEYADRMPVVSVKLGKTGIAKQIFLGTREADASLDYLHSFVEFARKSSWQGSKPRR
jgi:LysR family transcriptional regulator for metE and metH